MLRRQSLGTRALRMEFGLAIVLEGWGVYGAMPMARGAVGWTAPLRGQCRVDRVNAHTTWYFVRSVVCGVNQTQMCCSRESVSSGEGSHAGLTGYLCRAYRYGGLTPFRTVTR